MVGVYVGAVTAVAEQHGGTVDAAEKVGLGLLAAVRADCRFALGLVLELKLLGLFIQI